VELREMRPNEWQRASRRGAALEGLGAERWGRTSGGAHQEEEQEGLG
jgi:hypothetical protein